MIDIYEAKSFLPADECMALRKEFRIDVLNDEAMRSVGYDGQVRPVPRELVVRVQGRVAHRMMEAMMYETPAIEEHFGMKLTSCEAARFLRHMPGDHLAPHRDGNQPQIWDESRFRKVSAVIFISGFSKKPKPDTYSGGQLVLHGPPPSTGGRGPRLRLTPEPGTLICFRSETVQEMLPVTHGERFTVQAWLRE